MRPFAPTRYKEGRVSRFSSEVSFSRASGVAFLGNDRLVTAQEGEIGVKIWDTATKKLIRGLNVPETVRGLAVSTDGKWIAATGGREGMVKIWEVGTWREAYQVTAHPGKVSFGVDFGADGQTILSAGGDAAIVWKLPGGIWKAPPFEPPPPPRPGRITGRVPR